MKRVFVDTNILVDLIADRKPFSKYAIRLFSLAESKEIKLYSSSHALATTYYLLKRHVDEKILREVIYNILDYLNIVAIDIAMLKKGLKSKHKDFEDALQMMCAYSVEKMDCIVTRNIKDFKDSELLVLAPDEVVKQLE